MESATPLQDPTSPQPTAGPPAPPPHRLARSTRDRMWAGVAGGLAEYLDLDPALVRLMWVLATVLTGGIAIPVYIVAWIIMPRDDRPSLYGSQVIHDWSHELHNEAQRLADEARRVASDVRGGSSPAGRAPDPGGPVGTLDPYAVSTRPHGTRHRSTGIALVILGILLLSANAGLFRFVNWNLMWPIIFIGLGLALLARQADWR